MPPTVVTGYSATWGYAVNNPDGERAPGATIDVFAYGTVIPVALYTDASASTPLGNPFLADVNGYFEFYTPPQRIDVQLSGTGIDVPYTLTDYAPVTTNPENLVNVRAYGAVGDGATDDLAAFQAALAAIIAAGVPATFQVPTGNYRLSGQLTYTDGPPLTIEGDSREGSKLIWDDNATKGLVVTTTADPVSTNFTASGNVGDRTVVVANGAALTVGAWAFMKCATGNNLGSLTTKIHSIAGNNVTLEDALPCNLPIGNTPTLFSYVAHPLSEGLRIQSLTLRCVNAIPTQKLSLLTIFRANGFVVDNLHLIGSVGPLLTLVTCVDSWIQRSSFENAVTLAGTGVETQTSTGIRVLGNTHAMCQFGATFSRSGYCAFESNRVHGRQTVVALGRGVRFGESSNFGAINGNVIADTNLYGIYLQDSAYCTVAGNTVAWCGTPGNAAQHGIQGGGFETNFEQHNTFTGNTVYGCTGYGILINHSGVPQDLYDTISGNTVAGNTMGAVAILSAHRNVVSGNNLSAPTGGIVGAVLRVSNNGGGGGQYNFLTSNVISVSGGTSVAISTTGGGGNNKITNNYVLPGNTTSYNAADITDDSILDTVRLAAPVTSTIQVATGANLVETTAWTFDIPASKLATAGQGFEWEGIFTFAANANLKTLRAYIGTQNASGFSPNAVGFNVVIHMKAIFNNPNSVGWWCSIQPSTLAAVGFVMMTQTYATNTDDWTLPVTMKFTMQNGVANANDIIFRMGRFDYLGVPSTAYL